VEYPYLERDDTGGSSVSFKEINLELKVKPHVTPDNRISMTLSIMKNDIDRITETGVPSLNTKEAYTELLVDDGDTVVIGGIVKESGLGTKRSVPGLGRIPIIGWFFKSDTKTSSKEELLIFITPRIVQLKQRQVQF
jgi:type IV pilus assembly protein PilQ